MRCPEDFQALPPHTWRKARSWTAVRRGRLLKAPCLLACSRMARRLMPLRLNTERKAFGWTPIVRAMSFVRSVASASRISVSSPVVHRLRRRPSVGPRPKDKGKRERPWSAKKEPLTARSVSVCVQWEITHKSFSLWALFLKSKNRLHATCKKIPKPCFKLFFFGSHDL